MIIDTDIFIDLFRDQKQAKLFFAELDFTSHGISVVTEAEILSGRECENNGVRERLMHFLSAFRTVPVDSAIARTAAGFRRRYSLPLPDCLIAATAFRHGGTLWSRNLRDFSKIKEISVKRPY